MELVDKAIKNCYYVISYVREAWRKFLNVSCRHEEYLKYLNQISRDEISNNLKFKIYWMVLQNNYTLQKKRLISLNTIHETMQNGSQRKKTLKHNRASVT